MNDVPDVWYIGGEMRDISSLFYEHECALAFAKKLDSAIESMEHEPPNLQAWRDLRPLLRALADMLDPLHEGAVGSPEMMNVPVGLARRLRGKNFGDADVVGVLRGLLSETEEILRARDMEVLREIRRDARLEVSAIQRQLLPRR